jgi:predicted metal-binding membrane protein
MRCAIYSIRGCGAGRRLGVILRTSDRATLLTFVALFILTAAAWVAILRAPMGGDDMAGMQMVMAPTARDAVAYVVAWAVMMAAMMLPSALPMILLAGSTDRGYLLALGYVVVWAVFSLAATALQWALGKALILNPMMEVSTPGAGAALLIIAGVYQWTPLKHACLATCQSPMAYAARRWRSGSWGAFRMGAEHGVYCVGCCWALMLLLFAGGVMNLTVIVALSAFVAFEKLAPLGPWAPRVSGALLIALGVWMGLS